MKRPLLFMLLLFVSCATATLQQERDVVNGAIDDWHKAASEADESRYFAHMTSDAVFLGTDATERWGTAAFRAYAHPYFARGKGWTFVPRHRNVTLHGDTAWFDESLDSASYGECRGTGVLRREGGTWKIAHYNLTIPIPNALAKKFVEEIRKQAGTAGGVS
ncbi:MAG: nuclear transport factor 2 family protein [Acidobacteriota bacterium]